MEGSADELLRSEWVRRALISNLIGIGPEGDANAFAALQLEDELARLLDEICRAVIVVEGLMPPRPRRQTGG